MNAMPSISGSVRNRARLRLWQLSGRCHVYRVAGATGEQVVIEATQWFRVGDHPVVSSGAGDRVCEACAHPLSAHGRCPTLEGNHIVCVGDWIITGVKGEHYPCKPDIFDATYEPV